MTTPQRFRALLSWSGRHPAGRWQLLDYLGQSVGRVYLENGIYRHGISVPRIPSRDGGLWVLEGQRINVKRVVGWWRRPTDVEVHRLYHRQPVWFGA